MQTNSQVTGGVWAIGPVSDVPVVKLLYWRAFEVQQAGRPGRTRHFAGATGWHYDGLVSSEIVQFDPATRSGTSESGRVYQLIGRGTGIGMNADYVWQIWLDKCAATDIVDITTEVEESLSNLVQEARAEATEMVRSVAHNMLLSGKATSAESQRQLIEQEAAAILLSKKEQK